MRTHGAIWAALVVTATLLAGAPIGGVAAHPVSSTSGPVLAITQSPGRITLQSSLNVSLEVGDTANIQQVYFTFCSITQSVCYFPTAMASQGHNWFAGTTYPMTHYPKMAIGDHVGYNITIVYDNNTNFTEPRVPNAFGNLTLGQIVTPTSTENVFVITVSNQAYTLSGRVEDSATGAALPGADVSLAPANDTPTTTNATGGYSFPDLLNGSYTVSVTDKGYRESNVTVAIGGQDVVKNLDLTNASSPIKTVPPSNGSTPGFFSTAIGEASLGAVALVVVVIVAVVIVTRSRRKPGDPKPPVAGPKEDTPPSPPKPS
jgi:hypothetical protein